MKVGKRKETPRRLDERRFFVCVVSLAADYPGVQMSRASSVEAGAEP